MSIPCSNVSTRLRCSQQSSLQSAPNLISLCSLSRKRFQHIWSPTYMVQSGLHPSNRAHSVFDSVISACKTPKSVYMLCVSAECFMLDSDFPTQTGSFASRRMLKLGFILCRFQTTRHVRCYTLQGLPPDKFLSSHLL